MATQQIPSLTPESNPATTAPATVNYTSTNGYHITSLKALGDALDDLAWTLSCEAHERRGKAREAFQAAAKAVRDLMPDEDAMPPQPDPIAEARHLLRDECQRSQELLRTEAARVRKETAMKEAFAIPDGLLFAIVDAIAPGNGEGGYTSAVAVLEQAGWSVCDRMDASATGYVNRREPLRKLADLREKFPIHHLRAHAEEVIDLALTWCMGASLVYGKGQVPEGVLYPHIAVAMLPFSSWRDVPKEYGVRASVVERTA